MKAKKGKVYLIGAGPGDPTLITLKGRNILEKADAIVYDNLVNPLLLRYAKKDAELIYVGKIAGKHFMDQESINRLLIDLSKKGLCVARLKGGDSFIFGRGGEEAQALSKEGIEFEIVPGITSAIAVPSYAGIPLTHRKYASAVTFVTGHEDPTKEDSSISWDRIAHSGTIVILMGVGNLSLIKKRLIDEGLSPDTPFAIICNGTLPSQKVFQGKLKEIDSIAKKEGVRPPAIVVIGDVVRLRDEIKWFEKKVLFGKRILITRAEEQADELLYPLQDLGAECILFPTIKILPPESWDHVDKEIEDLKKYDWIIFTSVNGVKFFFGRIKDLRKDIRLFSKIKVCAIGEKTARILEEMLITLDLVPKEYRAEGVIECFRDMDIKGKRILIPRADKARDILPKRLSEMGAKVSVISVYRNMLPEVEEKKRDELKRMIQDGKIDLAIFTSPSTFKNLLSLLNISFDEAKTLLSNVDIACIGPVTEDAIRKAGLKCCIIPSKYTIPDLINAVISYYTHS